MRIDTEMDNMIRDFAEKNKIKEGDIIYMGDGETKKAGDKRINLIPVWKLLLSENFL